MILLALKCKPQISTSCLDSWQDRFWPYWPSLFVLLKQSISLAHCFWHLHICHCGVHAFILLTSASEHPDTSSSTSDVFLMETIVTDLMISYQPYYSMKQANMWKACENFTDTQELLQKMDIQPSWYILGRGLLAWVKEYVGDWHSCYGNNCGIKWNRKLLYLWHKSRYDSMANTGSRAAYTWEMSSCGSLVLWEL